MVHEDSTEYSILAGPVQAKQNVTHTAVYTGHQHRQTLAQNPFWKKTENMLCLCDITTLTLAPAVCFLELFNGNSSPLKPNVIDGEVAVLHRKRTYVNKSWSTGPQAGSATGVSPAFS